MRRWSKRDVSDDDAHFIPYTWLISIFHIQAIVFTAGNLLRPRLRHDMMPNVDQLTLQNYKCVFIMKYASFNAFGAPSSYKLFVFFSFFLLPGGLGLAGFNHKRIR